MWLVAAVTAVLALVLLAMRRRSANTRYLTACVGVLLMVAVPVATLILMDIPSANEPIVLAIEPAGSVPVSELVSNKAEMPVKATPLALSPAEELDTEASESMELAFAHRLQPVLPYLVFGWLVGTVLLSIRLMIGWAQAHRIARTRVHPMDGTWQERFAALACRLDVSRPVRLLESALARVPMVIGHTRPMLLIPASALSGLSVQQLDAVLAHELAHIRRWDYLVNLIQTVIETLLFYHPAVWWVGKRIRQERENCCDDVAADVCGERLAFARALVAMEEAKQSSPTLAVAAAGGVLIKRIRRLLGVEQEGPSRSSRWVSGAVVLLAAVAIAIGVPLASLAASPSDKDNSRRVRFPVDYPLGVIYVRTPGVHKYLNEGWRYFGKAKGELLLPKDKEVRLNISREASADLSPLAALDANAVHRLLLYGTRVDDDGLKYVAHLSGLEELDLRGTRVTNQGMEYLLPLRSLKNLDIGQTRVGDKGVKHISELPSVEILSLSGTRITDRGLAALSGMKSLRALTLDLTDISDAGLAHLKDLADMTYLSFWNTDITDAGLDHLSGLINLEVLCLRRTQVSDAGMIHLTKLEKLKELFLNDNVGDKGLARLASLPSLESISLLPSNHVTVTDEGLSKISRMRSLKELHGIMNVTDKGLAHLVGLRNLEVLDIGGKGITDAGMKHVAKLGLLKTLKIQLANVSDEGLATLAGMKSLERILISNHPHRLLMSYDGLRHLQQLPNLRSLEVYDLSIGETGLKHLRNMKGLKSLTIRGKGLDESELVHIAGLSKLERLSMNVRDMKLTDAGLEQLAGLTSMKDLNIFNTQSQITDDGLRHLSRMYELEYLQIAGMFTDFGLIMHLGTLRSLHYLNVSGSMFTNGGLKELQARSPTLQRLKKFDPAARQIGEKPKVGSEAPDFEVATLDGKTFRLSEQRGKTVLLHYWATWCVPCVASTSALKEFHDELARKNDQFVMLSISLDDRDWLPLRHAQRHGLKWPQARIGLQSKTRLSYGVRGVPTFFVIDPDGKIISTASKWNELKEAMTKASSGTGSNTAQPE